MQSRFQVEAPIEWEDRFPIRKVNVMAPVLHNSLSLNASCTLPNYKIDFIFRGPFNSIQSINNHGAINKSNGLCVSKYRHSGLFITLEHLVIPY